MATTVVDSVLFRDSFGTPQMRGIFEERALLARYVEVEVALAQAQARCGVIPANAASEIAARASASALDLDALRQETELVGYPILPLVHQLAKMCGEAGRYVHWGRDHPGHHGHGGRASGARCARADRGRFVRAAPHPRPPRHQAKFMLDGLVVDEARMRRNLEMTSGLIVAEAVMMGLAPHLGRNEAHDVVHAACRAVSLVNEKGGRLVDVLAAVPEVASRLDRETIERLTDPVNYLGAAREVVDRAVAGRA